MRAAGSGAFSLWKSRRLWRDTAEFGGKPHSSAALIDPPTPLQQYQSGLVKQQLLPDPQRRTAQGKTVAAKVPGTTQKSNGFEVVGTLPGVGRHKQLGYVDPLVMLHGLVEGPIP